MRGAFISLTMYTFISMETGPSEVSKYMVINTYLLVDEWPVTWLILMDWPIFSFGLGLRVLNKLVDIKEILEPESMIIVVLFLQGPPSLISMRKGCTARHIVPGGLAIMG